MPKLAKPLSDAQVKRAKAEEKLVKLGKETTVDRSDYPLSKIIASLPRQRAHLLR